MRSDLRLLAILATALSVTVASLGALFFGASPLYLYSMIAFFDPSNTSDIVLLSILYSPLPLWIVYLLLKLKWNRKL